MLFQSHSYSCYKGDACVDVVCICSLLLDCTPPLKSVAVIAMHVALPRTRIKSFAAMYTYLANQRYAIRFWLHLNLMTMSPIFPGR